MSEDIPSVSQGSLDDEAVGLIFDNEGDDSDIDFEGFDFDDDGNCVDRRDIRSFLT